MLVQYLDKDKYTCITDRLIQILPHCIIPVCRTDSEVWKDFLARPSLSYILRLLTGVCDGHEATQVCIYTGLVLVDNLECTFDLEES